MGIDLVRFAGPLVGSALLERVLQVLDLLAHGLSAAAIGLAITAAGIAARNRRFVRVGLAVLLAAGVAGLAANGLKLVFELPRPHRLSSYGFPSGHSTTAFAVAAVLARASPPAGPLFASIAIFGGLARVYYRDHYVIDVLGGGLLGAAIGLAIGRWLLGPAAGTRGRALRPAWVLFVVVAVPAVVWLGVYERELGRHLVRGEPARKSRQLMVAVPFGTEPARRLLTRGWSADERWNGTFPFVWAEGRDAVLAIPPLPSSEHRARLSVIPFVRGERLFCQVVEVDFNGTPVGRVLLDRGWNDYEIAIPERVINSSGAANEMEFRFGYAAVASERDPRRLAAAFRSVEIVSADSGEAVVQPGGDRTSGLARPDTPAAESRRRPPRAGGATFSPK